MKSQNAYIDLKAQLDESVIVHPFAYIGADVKIGPNCEIFPFASIMPGTEIGSDCKVYQGAVVGADPQDFRWKGGPSHCYIGNNVVIRENVIINRGIAAEGGTRIGDKVFVMAECHIGHDTHIVGGCVLGNGVTIAGDVEIDFGCILSSNAIVHEGVHMGKYSMLKGGCRVSSNVPPYVIIAHNPASYYGVNAIIMRKTGKFTEQNIDDAAKAYRHIYQCSTSLFNALRRIEADIADTDIRREILGFIKTNNLKLVGTRFDD